MAYATHGRFQFGGELDPLGNGSWGEIWECTVNVNNTVFSDIDASLATLSESLIGWWQDTFHPYRSSTRARLSYVKLNEIGPDGKYTDPTHPHTHAFTPVVGLGTPTYPGILSVAYSWSTSRLRGPGSKGRVYVPNAYALAAAGTETISTEAQGFARDDAKALLSAISTTVGGFGLAPCVSSKVDASNTTITGVRVGKVIDVQRRRKNKIPETYVSASWP